MSRENKHRHFYRSTKLFLSGEEETCVRGKARKKKKKSVSTRVSASRKQQAMLQSPNAGKSAHQTKRVVNISVDKTLGLYHASGREDCRQLKSVGSTTSAVRKTRTSQTSLIRRCYQQDVRKRGKGGRMGEGEMLQVTDMGSSNF